MKKILSVGESILLISGIVLVVKGTSDIYNHTKNKIVELKNRRKLAKEGYVVVD